MPKPKRKPYTIHLSPSEVLFLSVRLEGLKGEFEHAIRNTEGGHDSLPIRVQWQKNADTCARFIRVLREMPDNA